MGKWGVAANEYGFLVGGEGDENILGLDRSDN